jgi:Cys-Gly metallodipeptidase DUG1
MSQIPSAIPAYINQNENAFIKRLADAVAIPSISCDAVYRKHVFEMADFLAKELTKLGVETKKVPLGKHVMDGQELELPPAILGKLGKDKGKKTILIYGHFDVQPVSKPVITLILVDKENIRH